MGDYDFIVVGAGAGGAVTAARLSEKFKVLLIESGPRLYENPEKHDAMLGSMLLGSERIGSTLGKGAEIVGNNVPFATTPDSAFGLHMQLTPFMLNFMSMTNASYFFNTVPQIYAQKREITYPRGHVVGGSTASNWLVFYKGTRRDFDELWRDKHGLEEWGYDDVERYLRKFETAVHIKDKKRHGTKGPIKTTISNRFLEHPAAQAWHRAALRLGWPEIRDANDPENQYGASDSWQQFVTEDGRRSDASEFIRAAEAQGRVCWNKPRAECGKDQTLHIWTEKRVVRVIIDEASKRAKGVEFVSSAEFPTEARSHHPDHAKEEDEGLKHRTPFTKWDSSTLAKIPQLGSPVQRALALDFDDLESQYIPEKRRIPREKISRAYARREVVLSAGAIATAQLLLLSGIGPGDHLRDHNLRVLADLPVGQRVQDHQEVTLTWKYPDGYEPPNDLAKEASSGFPGARAWIARKPSPYGSNQVVSGVEGSPDGPNSQRKVPKWHLHHILLGGLESLDFNLVLNERLLERPYRFPRGITEFFGNKVAMLHTHTCELSENHAHGRIELRSGDPLAEPFVDPRYGSNHEDNMDIVDCIKNLRQIMDATEAPHAGEEFHACKDAKTDEQLLLCVRNMVWGHHISGSAPMGTCRSKHAVTDSRARVYHIEGLRVVDASLFPEIPHGNPTGIIYGLAERISDMIKEDYGIPIVKDEL